MSILLVSDDDAMSTALVAAMTAAGLDVVIVKAGPEPEPFDVAAARLAQEPEATAVVVALAAEVGAEPGWEAVLASHRVVPDLLYRHAAWLWAAAVQDRALRVVHVVPAHRPALATAAQAVTQAGRAANDTPRDTPVLAFAVAVESPGDHGPAADLVARLAHTDDTAGLAGAELVVGPGWLGLRRHPGPLATVSFGGGDVPRWVDGALQQLAAW